MFECVCLLLPGRFDWMWHSFSSHIFLDQLCVFSIGKTMVLWLLEKPVVMYWCENWTIKKSECWRIDAFELWCSRRLLRVPWTSRKSNQSTLKDMNPECYWKDWCWSWSSNTLATWCEELIHWKRPWSWVRLKARGEVGNRGWVVGWHLQLNGHEFE